MFRFKNRNDDVEMRGNNYSSDVIAEDRGPYLRLITKRSNRHFNISIRPNYYNISFDI